MCECDRVLYASLRYSAIKRDTDARLCHDGSHPEIPLSSTRRHRPRMTSSPTSALNGFRRRNPRATRGCHDDAARCTERDRPPCDAVPIATCRPGWTVASHPRGLASELVIPPLRGHRQPYAEARKRSCESGLKVVFRVIQSLEDEQRRSDATTLDQIGKWSMRGSNRPCRILRRSRPRVRRVQAA